MKHKMLFALVLVCILSILAGCATNIKNTDQAKACVKCGKKATTTIAGTAESLQRSGVPISACKKVSSTIYSADICGACAGPVMELKPDPTWG